MQVINFFSGYDIPKGTNIFVNNHSMNMTSKEWGDGPHLYNPEHFLTTNENGEKVFNARQETFKPFSLGKRSCLGYKIVDKISLLVRKLSGPLS